MDIAAFSDKGIQRVENQDHTYYLTNQNQDTLAIVCDGIGGADFGSQASEIAANYIGLEFSKAPKFKRDYEVDEWIRQTLNQANEMIFSKAIRAGSSKGMGTTAVGTIITSIGTYIFNVGDSRLYAQYPDGLIQMSEDHSILQELLRQKKISPEEAKSFGQRNTLTNALGIWRVFRIDVDKISPDYSRLLICSDGLHSYVEQDKIEALMDSPRSARQKAMDLVDLANKAGGWDNCSVIVIEKDDRS